MIKTSEQAELDKLRSAGVINEGEDYVEVITTKLTGQLKNLQRACYLASRMATRTGRIIVLLVDEEAPLTPQQEAGLNFNISLGRSSALRETTEVDTPHFRNMPHG
jgi:hypothetical protein